MPSRHTPSRPVSSCCSPPLKHLVCVSRASADAALGRIVDDKVQKGHAAAVNGAEAAAADVCDDTVLHCVADPIPEVLQVRPLALADEVALNVQKFLVGLKCG